MNNQRDNLEGWAHYYGFDDVREFFDYAMAAFTAALKWEPPDCINNSEAVSGKLPVENSFTGLPLAKTSLDVENQGNNYDNDNSNLRSQD